jgi:hypothetical protein
MFVFRFVQTFSVRFGSLLIKLQGVMAACSETRY